MQNKIDFTDKDVDDMTDGIGEPTIPVKILPDREWISKQLQELASRILVDQEMTGLELKWSLETKQCTITLQLDKVK